MSTCKYYAREDLYAMVKPGEQTGITACQFAQYLAVNETPGDRKVK